MTDLHDLLGDIADDAKHYGSVDQAVRVLRRRKGMARFAQVGMAAAVVVATIGVVLTYTSPKPGPTPDPEAPQRVLSWLPSTLKVPRTPPSALPTDRGVGPASLVYQVADQGLPPTTPPPGGDRHTPYLVSADGAQYRLPPANYLGLSPDGRWLLSAPGNQIVLRDLTGTTTKDLSGYVGLFFGAWASNGSRLAFATSTGSQATVVDLPSTNTHTISLAAYPDTSICGVQDSGDLILCPLTGPANHVEVWLVDGGTGALLSHKNFDLSSALTATERKAESIVRSLAASVRPLAGGTQLLVRTTYYDSKLGLVAPNDMLAVDLSSGTVTKRFDLPAQAVGSPTPQSGGFAFTYTEGRGLLSALPDGVLLAHTAPRGTGAYAMVQIVRGIELLDPQSGRRSTAATISGNVSWVIIRGGVVGV